MHSRWQNVLVCSAFLYRLETPQSQLLEQISPLGYIRLLSIWGWHYPAGALAAKSGHKAVVRLLIERDGVDLNAKENHCGLAPLICAAGWGHEAVVRLLLEGDGVDIDAKDDNGGDTLSWAADNGNETVVRLLNDQCGRDMRARDSDDRCCASFVEDVAVVEVEGLRPWLGLTVVLIMQGIGNCKEDPEV